MELQDFYKKPACNWAILVISECKKMLERNWLSEDSYIDRWYALDISWEQCSYSNNHIKISLELFENNLLSE